VEHVFDKYIIPFLKILAEKLSKLDSLFFSKGIVLYLDGEKTYPVSNATDISGGLLFYQSIYTKTLQEMLGSSTEKLRFTYNLFDMLYEDNKLNFIVTVEFHFKSLYYIVDATASEPRKPLKLYYDSIFTLEEMDEIATTITKSALADIEEKIDAFHRHADN
jgi:hypothetical protein